MTQGLVAHTTARGRREERLPVRLLALASLLVVGSVLATNRGVIAFAVQTSGVELLLWISVITTINLFFHFDNDSLQFTLDLPMLLAVGALYHPAVAAAVALIAEMDVREFGGRTSLSRAVFNRAQTSLSLFVSSLLFHSITSVDSFWLASLLGMVAAFACFYVLNGAAVTAVLSIRTGQPWLRGMRRLIIGRPGEFFLTYLGYGVLSLVLAHLFRDVGPWSVILFLIPTLVAHVALVRADRLEALAGKLRSRERLLERLSDRIVEERKDERLRIASDLHDEVLQYVTKVWMQSRLLERSARGDSQLGRDARELVADTELTMSSLREVISDLQRSPLGRGGLVATLQQLVRDLRFDWAKRIELDIDLPASLAIPPDVQLVAYQIAREGLINASSIPERTRSK